MAGWRKLWGLDRVACSKMGTEKSLVELVEGVKGKQSSETEAGVRTL